MIKDQVLEKQSPDENQLEIIKYNKDDYLKISNADTLRSFFMSLVSPSNHWMFISSNGGVTAGRKNAKYSLFPYYTDDKVTEFAHVTGSKTIFKVATDDGFHYWEPFSKRFSDQYNLTRNLYKSIYGHKLIFEEINNDLQILFSYEWNTSDEFGFVKKSRIKNLNEQAIEIECVDGLQNILPANVDKDLQVQSSNLVDAYKRCELDDESGMGIYALSAIPVDKAEPSESLKANIVWSLGVKKPTYLLSSLQLENFRNSKPLNQEKDIKAEKGAYFVHQKISLKSSQSNNWSIVADVNYNQSSVIKLIAAINDDKKLAKKLEDDIDAGTQKLIRLTAAADGLQFSSDQLRDIRHYSNTIFNIMRGGIFDHNYLIENNDFIKYITRANHEIAKKHEAQIGQLGHIFSLDNLRDLVKQETDPDLARLCLEYLPLKFSRRHGDPSRPWNEFSINLKDEEGAKILDYEGNWRDIFQNWESLAYSYPAFIEGMIFKFLNASTFDGYNPYRLTKEGFDWEVIEPDDPWSYIGYWGDHQIIYLLKFLEFFCQYNPERLNSLFDKELFVYANVPYKIKPYNQLVVDPKDTIEFDHQEDKSIRNLREELGSDGALLRKNGKIIHVNFIEKILATTLSKFSNFVVEAGIWMNTQRPEWNDANNALVGNGVSMVTLCYLRRFMTFFHYLTKEMNDDKSFSISEELHLLFQQIKDIFTSNEKLLNRSISDQERKEILDQLGNAASQFRINIYQNNFTGYKNDLKAKELKDFIDVSLGFLEHAINANKREDKLYHAYNLISLDNEKLVVSNLEEMLEGQVAVLSSKYLKSSEAVDLLDALKQSALFREDQFSYLLYPNKNLKGFLERNQIPEESVKSSELLSQLITDQHLGVIQKDVLGKYHFNGNFRNVKDLKQALQNLRESEYDTLVEKEFDMICQIFEQVFNHKAFTGRSGTFYGYEGLGSIYWHMVSKLQLAVQETCLKAIQTNESEEIIGRLLEHYYEINEGIGVHKSPQLYGAFPTDPYSHTPYSKGAQQPGMTGQVKEDILCRFGELGIQIDDSCLLFKPTLLKASEFLQEDKKVEYVDINGTFKEIMLQKDQLFFTICQTPVIFCKSDKNEIKIELINAEHQEIKGQKLSKYISKEVFDRTGEVKMIKVNIDQSNLK